MFYPINYLRNVALTGSQTEYVYLTDADLIPGPGMYEVLMKQYIGQGQPRHNQVGRLTEVNSTRTNAEKESAIIL